LLINAVFLGAAFVLLSRGQSIPLVLLGGGAVATLILAALAARQEAPVSGKTPVREPVREQSPKAAPAAQPAEPQGSDPVSRAVQVLSLLQRKGRLIDFLQEDLGAYEDAQIGAAVRNIHDGCRQALREMVELRPVLEAEEGAEITVPAGFDPQAIRLTGKVVGQPPFKGVLRHRGWQTKKVELPEQLAPMAKGSAGFVIQAAEVEV
jgi:hypothetical protein